MSGKVVVTGAAGFIGSHLVDVLIAADYEVIAVDNLIAGDEENINKNAKFYQVDIRDGEEIKKITRGSKYFFHLAAAMPIVRPPFEDTIEHEEVNVIGTINCLNACVGSSVEKFLFASSTAVYGQAQKLPIYENEAIDLQSRPYSIQKFSGEQHALLLGQRHNIDTVSLRLFANYGPRSLDRKKGSNAYSPVIGIFLKQNASKKPLTITGDGSQTRDFIHVFDTARIFRECAENKKVGSGVYNVCSGQRISIKDLADLISMDQTFIERTYGEVEHIHGSMKKLNDLGIESKIDLREGLISLSKFLKEKP